MKAFTVFISLALAASVGMNVWLWQQRATQLTTTEAGRAGAAEADALRAENETLKTQRTAKPTTADADVRELARLRNEIGQLRQQKTQADAQAAQAMAQLQAQVAGAKDKMEELKKGSEELLKMTLEQMTEARQRAQAIACVNNLKQIGLALRISRTLTKTLSRLTCHH